MKHKRVPILAIFIMVLLILVGTSSISLAASPGDVIVNEIMNNPSAVLDENGEWFEIYNTTSSDIDIDGWTIRDDDIDNHVINNGGPLMIPAGGYLILGNNADSATNGGVSVNYSYNGGWFLSNGGDEVILEDETGTEIDRVEYDGGPNFPDPNGASMSLSDPTLDNNVGANWCEAVTPFGDGDLGTPGAANDCTAEPPTVGSGDVIVNEIMNNPAAVSDSNGEWFEVLNTTGDDIDIDGWTIADEGSDSHTISNGAPLIVPAGDYLVLGRNADFSTNGGVSVDYEYSSFFLANGDDEVILTDTSGAEVNRVEYDGGPNFPDPTGASMSLIDPILDNNLGQSWCTSDTPFGDGDLGTPGDDNFCIVTIMEIQGSGSSSPIVGAVVTTEGVITANFPGSDGLNGFFIQDAVGDGNPATSDGVFVFAPGSSVTVGDLVHVTGEVQEYFGMTELGWVSDITSFGPGPSIAPTVVTMPVTSSDDWEAVEGMLILIDQELSVSDNFNLGRYGELLLSVNGRLQSPTNVVEPGAAANALQDANNLRSIQLDDGSSVENPEPLPPYVGPDNTLRAGDTTPSLTGVVGYAFGTYEIHPTTEVTFTRVNDRPEFPDDLGGSLKVASFNVLNYFTTIDNGNPICGPGMDQGCRGADSPEEFTRQRDKIISAIVNLDADIVGLMEIENNESESLQDLVNGLNDATAAGTYDFIDAGYVGEDVIKVGIIYQPGNVTPVGDFAVLDSSVDPNFNDDRNRAVLAQTFAENASGEILTVAINHLKSKGSPCADIGDPDTGDGQGNCNLTRLQAAIAEVNWLLSDPTNSGDRDFMILGDLNSYNMEDPIDAIVDSGFTNLGPAYLGDSAYSYVFFGQAGALDHALSSPNLTAQVAGATIWHINGDEPSALDYNSYNQDALYNPDQYRSSDHDPVVVELNLTEHITNEDGCYIAILEGSPYSGAGTIVASLLPQIGLFDALRWASQEGLPADACYEIHGSSITDKIRGGHEADTIFGYDGDDGLLGREGDDTFTGGPGADLFIGQSGHDTVLDFEAGVDSCNSIEEGCE